MKGCASLIEPSEFDRCEVKLGCNGCDGRAGIGIVTRYEYGLPMSLDGRIGSKLCRRKMIEGLYEACPGKCLRHDFRRETASQIFRRDSEGIRSVHNNLAVPLLELLGNILVRTKWHSEEDDLSLIGVLN